MSAIPVPLAIAVAAYFLVVTLLGVAAGRSSRSSPEEYFLAGRGLGTAVLFMALFGTNCTTFVLVGIPGLAYRMGIGVFGLNAAIVALGVPLTFWAIGAPARRMAQRLGALTPAELYARRLASPAVGLVLFLFFTVYTVPYMVQGVKGAALVLSQASGGGVAPWAAGLGVLVVVLVYTSIGGMRGNGLDERVPGSAVHGVHRGRAVSDGPLPRRVPGRHAARPRRGSRLAAGRPDAGSVRPRSLGLVGPGDRDHRHRLPAHVRAADGGAGRRGPATGSVGLYPLALVLLWVPVVLIGVWARGAFPDLDAPDQAFYRMAAEHLPAFLGTLAFVAILAAAMSTLDAQILTLSSMLLRDAIEPRRPIGPRGEVLSGRLFTLAIAAVVYVLSLSWGDSVFAISRKAFEGYTTLVPTLFLALRWRRSTAAGALASILVGNAVLVVGWILGPAFPGLGLLPVAWAFVAASLAFVGVSLVTAAPSAETLERAY